jgi:hypothetical protein
MVILVRNAPSVSDPQYVYAGSRVIISLAVLYEPPLQHHRWIPGEIPPAGRILYGPNQNSKQSVSSSCPQSLSAGEAAEPFH